MEEKKGNGLVIVLIITNILTLVLCVLFALDVIEVKKSNSTTTTTTTTTTTQVIDNNNDIVLSKTIDVVDSREYNETFNGITVLVKTASNMDEYDWIDYVSVNGVKVNYDWSYIDSISFFGDYVILTPGSTSMSNVIIYDTKTNTIIFDSAKDEVNYRFIDYNIQNNLLNINFQGCGAQCGVDNDDETLTINYEYKNGLMNRK